MILFFDTSALVKFFHREAGADVVVSLITDPGNSVWLSELARLEFVCALHRKCRMKEIGEDQLSKVIEGFTSEFSRFNSRKIGSAVLEEACKTWDGGRPSRTRPYGIHQAHGGQR